uniref:DNA-directed RNA polymerase III subunit RPC6 n=1 Tax=Romanomermis culicivorax TaxID=13658 RepID=A0A915JP84_ROMCU
IWIRDIKEILKLHVNTINKVLKTLESRKLIKAIKPVGAAASKKIYMLFELEPDSSVSGGAFYSGQEFDSQFVDLLNQQCLKYLKSKAQAAAEKFPNDFLAKRKSCLTSSSEILQHIKELKISKIDLSLADVEKILDTVVFDGNAQKELGVVGGDTFYAATKTPNSQTTFCTGLVKAPCAFCPLFEDCRPKGLVSPATCVYFKEWLAE